MRTAVDFTHLVTGKTVTIAHPESVAAVIHGPMLNAKGQPEGPDRAWLVLENVPAPIPVMETHDEVLVKLGLKEPNQ